MRLAGRLALLLPQVMQDRDRHLALLGGIDLDIVTRGMRREDTDHSTDTEPTTLHQFTQHAARIRIEVAGRLADHLVGEDVRESSGELPSVEERHPIEIIEQLLETDVVKHLYPRMPRRDRPVRRPVERPSVGAGGLEGERRLPHRFTGMLLTPQLMVC